MSQDHYQIVGDLSFATVDQWLKAGLAALAAGHETISLHGVRAADSAGISLLLEWQRHAHNRERPLHYIAVPDNLQKLAALYGVDNILFGAAE